MNRVLRWTSLTTLLAGAGLAAADSTPCGGCGVPTVPAAPITVYRQPQPLPPREAPPCRIPSPVLWRMNVAPPEWREAPPPPPVKLFRGAPPPVEVVRAAPPPVQLFRGQAPPALWKEAPPPPGVTLFRMTPQPPAWHADRTISPVTLYRQPQPAAAEGPCECAAP